MTTSTRRAVVRAPHRIELEERALPDPGPGEALLRTLAVGICGSDLHVLEGAHPFVALPVFPGHEVVAEVEAAGEGADRWRGRRVVLEPALVCGACRNCRRGRDNICEHLAVMGFQAPGGMGERFLAPADRLHGVPDAMSLDAAVLVEPVAVATHAARMVGPVEGRDVAVVGAGTIGLLCAQVALAGGAASVAVSDVDAGRRALAAGFGLEARESIAPQSVDVTFECVGVEGALRQAVASSRKGAKVAVVGVYGADPRVQAGLVQDWELTLQGCLMYTGEDYREAIRLLEAGAIDADRMISARYPLEAVDEAFQRARARGDTLKVVIEPRGSSGGVPTK